MCNCCGNFGGIDGSYNTPMNTVGIGDIVPAGANGELGSGDLFGTLALPMATKKDIWSNTYSITKKKKEKKKRKKVLENILLYKRSKIEMYESIMSEIASVVKSALNERYAASINEGEIHNYRYVVHDVEYEDDWRAFKTAIIDGGGTIDKVDWSGEEGDDAYIRFHANTDDIPAIKRNLNELL